MPERRPLRYMLRVAGAVTTALAGGALVVNFGFVARGPRGLAVVGLVLAWSGWMPFAGRASSCKSELLRGCGLTTATSDPAGTPVFAHNQPPVDAAADDCFARRDVAELTIELATDRMAR